ncbi:MAG: PhnD/SsuA/transferrin family substrate-binding protein [Candidatus Omnitrophota bacterium]|jgi:PAS domain S-box-containing protein
MKCRKQSVIVGVVLSLCLFLFIRQVEAQANNKKPDVQYKIGVLATRGKDACLKQWQNTAQDLTDRGNGISFIIVPLELNQIFPAVRQKQIDFIITDPAVYVELEGFYGAQRIATLKNRYLNKGYTVLSSVIFTRMEHKNIKNLNDLRHKAFMAVHMDSLGGWLASWRELKAHRINPATDFKSLRFGETDDKVVYAVLSGKADAGSVNSTILERMAAEGKIDIEKVRILNEIKGWWQGSDEVPFFHSTSLYPEWPFAKLKHAPAEVAEYVARTLLSIKPDDIAAVTGKYVGWTVPSNYQLVHDCMKELKVGVYKDFGKISLRDVLKTYWYGIVAVFILLAGMIFVIIHMVSLNRKLNQSQYILKNEQIALRKERDKAQNYLDIAATIIIIINRDQTISLINKKGCEVLGYPQKEIIGKNWFDMFIPADIREEIKGVFVKIMSGETASVVSYKNKVLTKTGATRIIAWYSNELRDEEGKIIASISSGEDITDQKLMEEELKHKVLELEKFNKFAIDRELKMVELKEKIKCLEAERGNCGVALGERK